MKTKFVKRLIAMALVACMGCAVVGCSDKDGDTSKNDSGKKDNRTTYEILKELNMDDYITLGEYKGLKLEKVIKPVTEDEMKSGIEAQLEKYPVEVTDRTDVRKGDTVNIDFVGRMDGKEFDGGKAENVDLLIGSNSFIAGFESGLIGAIVGEECVLDLKFPDPYQNNLDLSGKPVEFTVTINRISAPLDAPTDAWVEEKIEGCSTIAEFEEMVRDMLKEANELAAEKQLTYDAWEKVVENSTIHKYPEVLVERGSEKYKTEVEYYAQSLGTDLEGYLKMVQATMDEYEKNAEIYGKNEASLSMINYAICQLEGIEIGGEAFEAEVKELGREFDCTKEELYKYFKQDDIEQTVLLRIIYDLLVEEAEVTEVESSK